jgi:ribosome-associated protein
MAYSVMLALAAAVLLAAPEPGVPHQASARYRLADTVRAYALERLSALIQSALVEPKIRKKTRPTKGSMERRIESKKRRGATKQQRRVQDY